LREVREPQFKIDPKTFKASPSSEVQEGQTVLHMKFGKGKVIVVDGGSDDNTVLLATPYADKVLHAATGRACQMNVGAEQASAGYLLFLHADSFISPTGMHALLLALDEGAIWGRFNIRLLGQHSLFPIIAFMMNVRSRWTGIATGDQAIFVEKYTFEQVGRFPNIALMEDIALSKQLKKISPPVCLSNTVSTSTRRWLGFGIVKTVCLMWWVRLLYFIGISPDKLVNLYRQGTFWTR